MPKQAKPAAEKTTETVVSAPQPTEITLPEAALPAAERQAEAEAAASGTPADSAVAPANSASSQTVPAAGAVTVTPAANINSINTNTTNATSATAVNTEAAKVQSSQAAAIASKPSSTVDFNTLKEKAAQNAQATNVVAGSSAIKPVAPATPAATTAPAATSSEHAPAQKVSFSITEKTWIQATDKSGKVVFERILQAGSTDGFDGQPPFNVVIGNAKATKLSYLGKPVDLAPSTTQNNVARIKLE
jgi:cytoskeleton protein RodZ